MIEGEQKEYRDELETHVLDLARKALTAHEYTLIKSLILSKPSTPFATLPAIASPSSSSGLADKEAKEKGERKIDVDRRHQRYDREPEEKEENRDAPEEERAASRPAASTNEEYRYPTTTIDSSRLQRLIQKMKEYEVKKIIENLTPEEKKEGLKNLQSLENVVKKKSVVLQLCTAATSQLGYED